MFIPGLSCNSSFNFEAVNSLPCCQNNITNGVKPGIKGNISLKLIFGLNRSRKINKIHII